MRVAPKAFTAQLALACVALRLKCASSGDTAAAAAKTLADERIVRDDRAAASSCFLRNSSCSFSKLVRGQSTLVYPGGETRCLSSRRPEFGFQVVPGDSDKLVLYFQGGGVCWNEFTAGKSCWEEATPDGMGIFNGEEATNPFRSYTIVSVLYCSGDLHFGAVNNSWGLQAGWANTRSVLDWTLANFPSVESLVVSGSSAGALATQFAAKYVLRMFEGLYARAVVIADSFASVAPPTITPSLMRQFNACDSPPVKEENLTEACHAGELRVADLFLSAMRSFPDVPFAIIHSKTDFVQILFWDLWVDMERTSEGNIEGIQFMTLANDLFRRYDQQPNFVSYMVNGAHHNFMATDLLFTADPSGEASRGAAFGPMLTEWLGSLLVDQPSASSVCLGIKYPRPFWGIGGVGVLYCDSMQSGKLLNMERRADQ